jgi:hypothetical protein
MQVLTDQTKAKRPGVVIYGVGDAAHRLEVSGHNEDDTPGVRAEDQDADDIPEHRAIDIMLGTKFTKADADKLVHDLVTDPANRARLLYVIFNRQIWSASRGWTVRPYEGTNPHTDHVHASGEADADDNRNPWNLSDWGPVPTTKPVPSTPELLIVDGELGEKTIKRWQQVMKTPVDGVISFPKSALVIAVQKRLKETVDRNLVVDGLGIIQNGKRYKTIGALQRYLKSPVDEVLSVPKSECIKALQRRLNENRF